MLSSVITARDGGRGRTVPVIADDGDHASVVLVCFPGAPRHGDRFVHGGREWSIVREKDHLRGFVARPTRS